MVTMIPYEGSFSLSSNVIGPGYQSVVPRGLVYERRNDEVWVAPLLPQLFYGADGSQLTTWRQYLPVAGSQTILSRVGGKPEVPREELWWRRVSAPEAEEMEIAPGLDVWSDWQAWLGDNWQWFVPVVATLAAPIITTGMMIAWDFIKLKRWA